MATINPTQQYDIIHTLTFAEASGDCPIRLYRGSSSATSGTVYYRAGTSGDWTSLSVSGTTTTFPVTSTTMQVAHNWDKSGNGYMTPSFLGAKTITSIAISQKSPLTGTMGNYFMYYYAYNCSSLTSLAVPDTSGLTSVGNYFMYSYASGCSSLSSLAVPDTSSLESVGTYFMRSYAYGCSKLTELVLPAVGWFEDNNVNWNVPSGRLGVLKGRVLNSDDLNSWKALTAEGKTLYTNYIRDPDLVYCEGAYVADLIRTIIQSQSYNTDTKRPITQSQAYQADTFRKINKAYQYSADTERITLKDYAYSADTKRKIIQGHVFTGDTKRKIIQGHVFTGDAKRKIIQGHVFTGDTKRATIKRYTFTADTLRKLKGTVWIPLGTFWSLDWNSSEDNLEATVTARDRLDLLRKTTFETSVVQTNATLYSLAEQVLQDAGLSASEYSIDTSLQSITIPYAWFGPISHREALRRIAEAGLAVVYADRDGIIQVKAMNSFGDDELEITADEYYTLRNPSHEAGMSNKIIVDTNPLAPQASQEVYRSNTPISIPASSAKTITAFYNMTPVINALATLDGSPAGVEISSATYYGWGASVKIQNNNASSVSVTLVITGQPLTVQNKERYIAQDNSSILEYGEIEFRFPDNPLVQTLSQAECIATGLLASVKNSRRDIEITWRGNPALLLGDKIKIKGTTYYVTRQELEWRGYLDAKINGRKVE